MKTKTIVYLLFFNLSVINFSCKKEPVASPQLACNLEEIFSSADDNPNLKCLIVYEYDHIVKEKYFQNGDSITPHDVRSVTKSVMSTLIGIAIDKGFIQSENQKIGEYLRPYVSTIDSIKANIKICDLLSMDSGISGDELTNPMEYNDWFSSPDQLIYTLNQPTINQPGQFFCYNSGAAHLLSAILMQATGMSTFEFAKQYLFTPLGITDHYWQTDKRGINNGGAGLALTPYDMLKIGELYLYSGVYKGTRIVSEEWIKKTTTFKITTNNIQPFGSSYGYLWWIGNIKSHDYFFANGYGGQFIVVVPDLNLIIVATNKWLGVPTVIANQQWYSTLDMSINRIISLYD